MSKNIYNKTYEVKTKEEAYLNISEQLKKFRRNRSFQFSYETLFDACRDEFKFFKCSSWKDKQFQNVLSESSYLMREIMLDDKRKVIIIKKVYPEIKDKVTLQQYLIKHEYDGIREDENLYECCNKQDVDNLIKNKIIRRVVNFRGIINQLFSMNIDNEYELLGENPNCLKKEQYMQICRQLTNLKQKQPEQIDKNINKPKQSKNKGHNIWVQGFAEMRKQYEEEQRKKIQSRKQN